MSMIDVQGNEAHWPHERVFFVAEGFRVVPSFLLLGLNSL